METPEKIWLIDQGDEVSWCNCPDPSHDIEKSETVEYVRADKHKELVELGKKISSVTAVTSQLVKDQSGNETMAILLDDIGDLLGQLDQLVCHYR
jgi:hypothetical protein